LFQGSQNMGLYKNRKVWDYLQLTRIIMAIENVCNMDCSKFHKAWDAQALETQRIQTCWEHQCHFKVSGNIYGILQDLLEISWTFLKILEDFGPHTLKTMLFQNLLDVFYNLNLGHKYLKLM